MSLLTQFAEMGIWTRLGIALFVALVLANVLDIFLNCRQSFNVKKYWREWTLALTCAATFYSVLFIVDALVGRYG